MICPYSLESYDFKLLVNTREIMKNNNFFEGLAGQNVEFQLGWTCWPPEIAIGPIWFKTEKDLNVAKLLI